MPRQREHRFLGAGDYLFTTPLYNYGIPSSFKARVDQIVVIGRTIHMPNGPLTAGRRWCETITLPEVTEVPTATNARRVADFGIPASGNS